MRDADGAPAFALEVEAVLGKRPRIIGGREEAELTFLGAVSGLEVCGDSVCVFDIGGGSTELIRADRVDRDLEIRESVSLDIGSVRLHERCLGSDPPGADEYHEVVRVVDEALSGAPRFERTPWLVGVADTVTTLSAIELGLGEYDPDRVHGSKLSLDALTRLREKLWSMSLAERRKLPGLHPLRADVIVVGAVIAERIVRRVAAEELVVSDRGVRWGLAERAL
jgi:exopolyphosphatase/guanosine-5'-triphosphate,3'-diphosphate pyrophosphatase